MATIETDSGTRIQRQIEDHGAAAAVLPYDPDRRCALLVRQPRSGALFAKVDPVMIEAPAGLIDGDEAPEDAARREAMEEVGVRLRSLQAAGAYFPMPGISSERIHLYLAAYSAEDRVSQGGGLANEAESIEVLEMPLAELWRLYREDRLADLKTLSLMLMLREEQPHLFSYRWAET